MDHLEKLPPKLDVLYEEAFSRIETQDAERAALGKDVLTWVVFAYRPLTVEEAQYAVARDPEVDWAHEENMVPESLLVSACCGLVVIESDSDRRMWCSLYSIFFRADTRTSAGSDRILRLVREYLHLISMLRN